VNATPEPEGEPASRLRELLERVVQACALRGSVEVTEDEETLRGTIRGEDLGLLIGRHGQTIDALEHLAFRIAYRDAEPRKRVVVDAAGYRDRRAAVLRRQADRAVAEAERFGRPVALKAMPAAERRLVHEYLRDHSEIETYSEGEEPDRHLVVAPVVT
jgi:spoIIIJ-associated protein